VNVGCLRSASLQRLIVAKLEEMSLKRVNLSRSVENAEAGEAKDCDGNETQNHAGKIRRGQGFGHSFLACNRLRALRICLRASQKRCWKNLMVQGARGRHAMRSAPDPGRRGHSTR